MGSDKEWWNFFLSDQLLWGKDGTMISRAFFMDGIDLKMASPAELAKFRG